MTDQEKQLAQQSQGLLAQQGILQQEPYNYFVYHGQRISYQQPGYEVSDTDHRILLDLSDIKSQLREIKKLLTDK